MPPERVLPPPGAARFCTRARRVRLSSSTTTWRPSSVSRRAWAMARVTTAVCSRLGASRSATSTRPSTTRRSSVASSGRSPTSSTSSSSSGSADTPSAMWTNTVVLPAWGGATISPRWPRPMGEIRSSRRPVMARGWWPSTICWRGWTGTRSLKSGRPARFCTPWPLTRHTDSTAGPIAVLDGDGLDPVAQAQAQVAHQLGRDERRFGPGHGVGQQTALALLVQVQKAADRELATRQPRRLRDGSWLPALGGSLLPCASLKCRS